jgi:prolyl-tRNA editing enzyme YbaK/EbsC (Cys-tRNA(Pro) deacylase)
MSMNELPPSAKKVQDAAHALGLDIAVREMALPTRTAEEAAAACGVTVGQIVKSLVFLGVASGKPYLLLVSGKNRVNEKGVAAHLGEKLKRPDADAVRALTGYAIGGIPPFGHDTPIATYMDRDLVDYDIVWAAAGTPKAVFRVEPGKLRDATGALVIEVK